MHALWRGMTKRPVCNPRNIPSPLANRPPMASRNRPGAGGGRNPNHGAPATPVDRVEAVPVVPGVPAVPEGAEQGVGAVEADVSPAGDQVWNWVAACLMPRNPSVF